MSLLLQLKVWSSQHLKMASDDEYQCVRNKTDRVISHSIRKGTNSFAVKLGQCLLPTSSVHVIINRTAFVPGLSSKNAMMNRTVWVLPALAESEDWAWTCCYWLDLTTRSYAPTTTSLAQRISPWTLHNQKSTNTLITNTAQQLFFTVDVCHWTTLSTFV